VSSGSFGDVQPRTSPAVQGFVYGMEILVHPLFQSFSFAWNKDEEN